MNAPERFPPDHLPDPWLFDTQQLLAELSRIRELALQIAAFQNDIIGRVNTVIDAVWGLEQTLRHLLTSNAMRNAHSGRNTTTPFQKRQTKPLDRQTVARPANARRRA
jgi:hypothetical protein